MSFWHSATFSNDGKKILFTDEWGGGSAPRCRSTDKPEWGANALFTIENNKMKFQSYYKLPAAQTAQENCVAHNGSLIPIPGREVMVQGWYQGGLSVFDWTDAAKPMEIALLRSRPGFRGSSRVGRLVVRLLVQRPDHRAPRSRAGSTSTSCCRARCSPPTRSRPRRASRCRTGTSQEQQKIVWPPSFALARAYLDQLERSKGLAAAAITDARTALTAAERRSGAQRKTALTALATKLSAAAAAAKEQEKVRTLSAAVTDLANATR